MASCPMDRVPAKPGVLAARPVGHGGRHDQVGSSCGRPVDDGHGDVGVGGDREVGPVLLGRANGYDQDGPGRGHVGPGQGR